MNNCNGVIEQFNTLSINEDPSESYQKLLEYGLSENVANALDAVFKQGMQSSALVSNLWVQIREMVKALLQIDFS